MFLRSFFVIEPKLIIKKYLRLGLVESLLVWNNQFIFQLTPRPVCSLNCPALLQYHRT